MLLFSFQLLLLPAIQHDDERIRDAARECLHTFYSPTIEECNAKAHFSVSAAVFEPKGRKPLKFKAGFLRVIMGGN